MRGILAVLKDGLHKLNYVMTRKQKQYGIVVFFLSIIGAALETLGVRIIVPFVQIFMNSKELMRNEEISYILNKLYIKTDLEFIIIMTLIVIMIFIVKNIYFMFLSWVL